MSDRIVVYVCQANDREHLRLEYVLPGSKLRRSRSARTSDPELAERARADWEYELNHGLYQEKGKISWQDFRAKFLQEHVGGKRTKTKEKYVCVFDVFEQVIHPERLSSITARTLSAFVQGMRARVRPGGKTGLAPWTQKNYLVSLRTAFGWAVEQGFLSCVPEFPKVKVPKLRPQPIPPGEWEKLFSLAPDDPWRAYLLCGWWGGLRLNEALQLRRKSSDEWPWLDLERERIILPARFVKADEDQWIPLHPVLIGALSALPEEGDRVFLFRAAKGTRSQGKEISPNGVSRRVIQLAKLAGVKLSMHKLRKGFGCRVAQKLGKGNAPILHRLMRHKSMQVTMEFYASVDDVLHEAIKELG